MGKITAPHVFKMDAVEGCVAHGKDKLAALLQADVRRAFNERAGNPCGDLRQAPGGAGYHHHASHGVRTAGDRGADVGVQQVFRLRGGVPRQGSRNFGGLRNLEVELVA
jgi:hypothetical protein